MPVDFKKWLLKYKIPHVVIWITVSLFLAALYYDYKTSLLAQLTPSFVLTALCFPAFYLAGRWLVPKFIYKRKFIQFFLSAIGLLLLSSVLDYLITQFTYHSITGIGMFPSVPSC